VPREDADFGRDFPGLGDVRPPVPSGIFAFGVLADYDLVEGAERAVAEGTDGAAQDVDGAHVGVFVR
jgi:hypothetical protein